MQPHELRVHAEKQDLDDKLEKLLNFIGSTPFMKLHPVDRSLLRLQADLMRAYSRVLEQRIERFPEPTP